MGEALKEAYIAFEKNEIPIGAVIVKDEEIISRGHNMRESTNDIGAHAEILALKDAAQKVGSWKLDGCIMYTTLEPCLMCYGAIKQSRIDKVYVGQSGEVKKDYVYSKYIDQDEIMSYEITCDESQELLKKFFKIKRREDENK